MGAIYIVGSVWKELPAGNDFPQIFMPVSSRKVSINLPNKVSHN